MISCDPKNRLSVLVDFPRNSAFRTLFFDALGAGTWAAIVSWVETDPWRIVVVLGPSLLSILGIILGLLQAIDDVLGGGARFHNTFIPFSHSSYINRFVVLYALIMPFGLVREFGYGTVIARDAKAILSAS